MDIPKDVLKAGLESHKKRLPSVGSGTPSHKLLQAQDYARRGLYDRAEQELLQLPETHDCKTKVLDLKGKMFAQRGRYAEAEKCWMEALSLDPGNQSYRRSLDALVESRQSFIIRLLKSNVPAVLVIVLLLSVVFNMIASKDEANYDNLSSRLDSIQQGIANARKQESKSVKQLEEKYQEVYRLREEAFLETESSYLHQMENLRSEKEELIRRNEELAHRNEELVRRNKELESGLEVIKLDSYK